MKKSVLLFLLGLLGGNSLMSQPSERRISRSEYIQTYKDDAIREMLVNGVPASITLSQGLLESGDGNSPLARYANNHFGIKCHSGWSGPTFYQDDDAKNECFRKYHSVYRSYKDHSEFLRTRQRYAFLFELKTTDYKGWARGLKKAGYATNPKYADLLIRIIEENNLSQFDKVRKMPPSISVEDAIASKPVDHKPKKVSEIKVHNNNIKYVIAKPGDSYFKIAEENEMGLWQLLKYNEQDKHHKPAVGEIVYLQPKRNKAKKENHVVSKGETIWDISQIYGVKVERLCKMNDKSLTDTLKEGESLNLRKG